MQVACDTEPKRNDDGMAGRQQSPSFTQREQEPHLPIPQFPHQSLLTRSVQQVNMDNMKMYLLPPSFACVTLCHTFHANSSGCLFSLLMRTINENKQPRARQQQQQHDYSTPHRICIFL